MEYTERHRLVTELEWSEIAGESVTIEMTNTSNPIYAFGSELAVLRLYRKWGGNDLCTVGYSPNLRAWYFANKEGQSR
jgi:hypothetical protein